MKKTILLITTAFLCTNVHASSNKEKCLNSINTAKRKITEIETALEVGKEKMDRVSEKQIFHQNNSGTALELKQCIFRAYDSFLLLTKPSGYETEPTTADKGTEASLKPQCIYAVTSAYRKIYQMRQKLKNEIQEKLKEAQAIADNTSLEARSSKFKPCITKCNEIIELLTAATTDAARAQADQDLTAGAQAFREQDQSVLILQFRTLVLDASPRPKGVDMLARFNNLITNIPVHKRQNIIDLLTLIIKKTDNTRRSNGGALGFSAIDLMEHTLKDKSLFQTEEIKTCAKELIDDDMYQHIAFRIVSNIINLPDAERSEVVAAIKNFAPIMTSERKEL